MIVWIMGNIRYIKADRRYIGLPWNIIFCIFIIRNPGKVLTYHTILQKIWGDGYGEDTQVLRSVMASTRRKIENHPAKPEYILTEIGIGYRMRKRDK